MKKEAWEHRFHSRFLLSSHFLHILFEFECIRPVYIFPCYTKYMNWFFSQWWKKKWSRFIRLLFQSLHPAPALENDLCAISHSVFKHRPNEHVCCQKCPAFAIQQPNWKRKIEFKSDKLTKLKQNWNECKIELLYTDEVQNISRKQNLSILLHIMKFIIILYMNVLPWFYSVGILDMTDIIMLSK